MKAPGCVLKRELDIDSALVLRRKGALGVAAAQVGRQSSGARVHLEAAGALLRIRIEAWVTATLI